MKQNLSNAVDAVADVGEAKSGSAAAARGLRAYDAVQSFAEKPVTVGVNAIYKEEKTNTHTTNSQVVASSITATNTLTLNATNELEIAGSDVGSANVLTVNANNINIHASEGTYTTETSSESKNASVGLYGTRMGQATVDYQENEMTTSGTTQRNSQLYAGGTANITSTGDTTLSGANIEARTLALNVGGDLNMQSLQDTQTIEGSSRDGSISGNVMTGTPTGASFNEGETSGERAWVSQTMGINGSESITVNVGGTTTLTGATIINQNAQGVEQNNLEVNTQHLVVGDIKDIDTYDATTAGAGIGSNDGAPSLHSVEYANNTTDKEQITRATIGEGSINTQTTTGTLNRDTSNIQEITRDEESNTELYASNRTLELLENPTEAVDNLKDKLRDVGLASHVEILENLPSASKGEDGEGDLIDNTIGAVLDSVGTAGILSSAENDGGYITQIATQLFGNNRAGIVVKDGSKLEAITTVDGDKLRERQPGDSASDWDYEQLVMVKTEDGIKPILEVSNPEGLDQVTVYRTNPDKQLVIEDGTDRSGNPALEEYKIRISKDDIVATGIDHLFTNGMFNNHDTAVYNQQTQQGGADGILNYNQQHGVIGDLLESGQDAIAVNTGISSLGTGGAGQTGELIVQMADTSIRNGDLTVGGHSQGTLMTQVGMTQQQDLGDLVQNNANAEFLVQYSGSPVNHNIAEQLIADIYGGEGNIEMRFDTSEENIVNNVFRSHVSPEDAVGSVLGYQSAGINNSENLGSNMWESFLSTPRLLGIGDPSPHSYYPCVIGCGNENTTPTMDYYVNPNASDGTGQSHITEYYRDNFTNRDGELTVDLNLLPESSRPSSTNKNPTILNTTAGGQ